MLNAPMPASQKLVLLALAEFANADGSNCFPSIGSIARLTSYNERTVRRALDDALAGQWIDRRSQGSRQGWRLYHYDLRTPPGADSTPARQWSGEDTVSAPAAVTCGHSRQNVRTLTPEGAGAVSDELGKGNKERSREKLVRPLDRFPDFYAAYPRKEAKPAAEKSWRRQKLDRIADQVIADVRARLATGGPWHCTDRKFIPLPATYLNQQRWTDEWQASSKTRPVGAIPRDDRDDHDIEAENRAELARFGVEVTP